jgi:hypothetical protein
MVDHRRVALDNTIHGEVASVSGISNFSIFQCLDGGLDGI